MGRFSSGAEGQRLTQAGRQLGFGGRIVAKPPRRDIVIGIANRDQPAERQGVARKDVEQVPGPDHEGETQIQS